MLYPPSRPSIPGGFDFARYAFFEDIGANGFAPHTMLMPGFQMSFAATIALICVYEFFTRMDDPLEDDEKPKWRRNWWSRLWLYSLGVLGTSLVAGTATAPFAAFHFNQFVNYGLPANLIAIPITSFIIMPSAVIAMLLMPFGLEEFGLLPWGGGLI